MKCSLSKKNSRSLVFFVVLGPYLVLIVPKLRNPLIQAVKKSSCAPSPILS